MVDEGIEELGAGGLGQVVAAAVVDVVEQPVLVLQLEVVPVLAAHEDAAVAVFQLQVVHALEDLREGLALLEVLPVVVGGAGGGLTAQPQGVGGVDELRVRSAHRPTGADGDGGVERAFDLAQLEADGLCIGASAHGDGDREQPGLEYRQAMEGSSGGRPLIQRGCMSCLCHVLVPLWILLLFFFWTASTRYPRHPPPFPLQWGGISPTGRPPRHPPLARSLPAPSMRGGVAVRRCATIDPGVAAFAFERRRTARS
ncbi:hypothetical protein D3C80_1228760 [compost metagenome]